MSGLSVEDLVIYRSGAEIVHGISLEAPAGEVTIVLGANGAGKTTLMEGISGLIPVKSGSVSIDDLNVSKSNRVKRARAGISHVEQGRPVFGTMTVEENLLVTAKKSEIAYAYELFPELKVLADRKASLLSGGEQQMLVIARALLRRPKVLLLDEMSLGLAPVIIGRIMPRLRKLADDGMAVLLVEQFAQMALAIGDSAYVLARGAVCFHGEAKRLLDDPELLQAAYLGEQ